MSHRAREHPERLGRISAILLLCLTVVPSHETLNHQSTPDASVLKIEAKDSGASITLGKDLVLSPPVSPGTKSIVTNANSDFNDVTSTKRIDSFVTPAIISRVSPSEDDLPKPASRDASPRGPHIVGSRYRVASKGSKAAWKVDSYLEALKHSRTSEVPREGIVGAGPKTGTNRREYAQGPIYQPETEFGSTYAASKRPRIVYDGVAASSPSDAYPQSSKPSTDYGDRYGPPQNHYGPPQNPYGPLPGDSSFYPQSSSYGPAGNSYPPPQGYDPSIHTSAPTAIYGAPYALPDVSHISILPNIDLGLPFALKLNAFTIAKIILKLVIFKMIVKFIAVICLLLFIPKLEIIKNKVSNKSEDDEEERSLPSPYASSRTLNDLESTVRSSVGKYEAQNGTRSNTETETECRTLACSVSEAFTFRESWTDYLSLFKSYVAEERRLPKREET